MVIDPRTSPRGQTLVSLVQTFLDTRSGECMRKKGRFALTPDEATQLAAALVEVAEYVRSGEGGG